MRSRGRWVGLWVLVAVMLALMVVGADRGWSPWTAGLPLAAAGVATAATIRDDDLANWRTSWRTGRAKAATVALAGSAIVAIVLAALEWDPVGALYGSTMLLALLILTVRGSARGARSEP